MSGTASSATRTHHQHTQRPSHVHTDMPPVWTRDGSRSAHVCDRPAALPAASIPQGTPWRITAKDTDNRVTDVSADGRYILIQSGRGHVFAGACPARSCTTWPPSAGRSAGTAAGSCLLMQIPPGSAHLTVATCGPGTLSSRAPRRSRASDCPATGRDSSFRTGAVCASSTLAQGGSAGDYR
jgi:hypothetical protein